MAGYRERLKESLQVRLSFWVSVSIIGMALIAGAMSFWTVFREAHELQDETLRQLAASYDEHHLPFPDTVNPPGLTDEEAEARVIVQYLQDSASARAESGRNMPLALPASLADGLHTMELGRTSYRLFVKALAPGVRIAVAQETAARDEIAGVSALHTLLPFLLLVPVMLVLVPGIVRRMFRPIAVISGEINRRGEEDLHPLVLEPLPVEVRPFGAAINQLLVRIAGSMEVRRRFVADAAHELRTPLTAISLQAGHLANAPMSDEARVRLEALKKGIQRSRSLLDQLLVHTRVQSGVTEPPSAVSVMRVYRHVLEELMPVAEAKNIDLGVTGGDDAFARTSELDLFTLVRNLADNAIRYTPPGGRVDLSVVKAEDRVTLEVEDTGTGIPAEYRQRVLDPFFRVPGSQDFGSGLGLSIVRTIVDRCGGRLRLSDSDNPAGGLKVEVDLPVGH